MGTALLFALLVVFLLCLGLFSGAETALFSLSSLQVKSYRNDPDKRKKLIAGLLSQPRDLLITMIILIIIMSILVQNTISSMVGEHAGWGISVGIPLALNLILGEVIPKSLALPNNARIAYKVAPLLDFMQKILYPIRWVLSHITNFVIRIFFFFFVAAKRTNARQLCCWQQRAR